MFLRVTQKPRSTFFENFLRFTGLCGAAVLNFFLKITTKKFRQIKHPIYFTVVHVVHTYIENWFTSKMRQNIDIDFCMEVMREDVVFICWIAQLNSPNFLIIRWRKWRIESNLPRFPSNPSNKVWEWLAKRSMDVHTAFEREKKIRKTFWICHKYRL